MATSKFPVLFIKDHPVGIAKGAVRKVDSSFLARLNKDGYVEAITEDEMAKHIQENPDANGVGKPNPLVREGKQTSESVPEVKDGGPDKLSTSTKSGEKKS